MTTTESFESADRHLRPSMSMTQLMFIGISSQIGSGWLFAVLPAAGIAGPAAVIAWVIASLLIALVAVAYLEISVMLPRSGAVLRYPYLTHGRFAGWVVGWAYWLAVVSIPPIEAEAVLTYLGGAFPDSGLFTTVQGVPVLSWPGGILAGVGLMILFFALNFFGARLFGESNRWMTIWKLVIPTATFCFLFVIFKGSNFSMYGGFLPKGIAPVFQSISTSGIMFALITFRQSLDFGGEVRNPRRNIPLATYGTLAIPLVIYTLLQLAFIGSIDWSNMGIAPGDWSALTTSNWADGPFFHALNAAGIAAFASFGTVLLIDAGVSPAGAGLINMGAATRGSYGFSIYRNIPRAFQRMNRFGIPWLALVSSLVVGCLFFIPAPSWYQLIGFTSAATVLTYIMGGVGLVVLRKTAPSLYRPFRLRWAKMWSIVGFLAALLLLYWAGFAILINVMAATFIGLTLFAGYSAWRYGWCRKTPAVILALVFLGAWIYINRAGGWVLTVSGKHTPGSWSFGVYDIAFSAAVVFFCVALWLMCNSEGRKHIQSAAWIIWLLLATLPLSFFAFYGPSDHSPIAFPWGTVIEIGIGIVAYFWGVASGFATDEIKSIVAAEAAGGAEPEPTEGTPPAASAQA